jgi:protein-disulfide isomerase
MRSQSDLTSAQLPARAPDDHVRGEGRDVIIYLDLACHHCAAAWPTIEALQVRVVVRHFPVESKHPRAPALHAAAEAAGRQGSFFQMVDSVLRDQGHLDDPHLWRRAESFGMDLNRFESDRRSQEVAQRVRRDFESGIRSGVTGTPAIFVNGELVRLVDIVDLRG